MRNELTKRQREMLEDLSLQSRFYEFIDLRTFNALAAKGLAALHPDGTRGRCAITHAGKAALTSSPITRPESK
jgi:hypothetical protein